MNDNDIQVSILRSLAELKAIKKEWDVLLNDISDRTIFQSYLFHHNVIEAFEREKEIYVLLFKLKGKLIGLLPLRIISRNLKIMKYKILEFLTHNRSDYQDIIISINKEKCLSAFLKYISENKAFWDLIFFKNIPIQNEELASFKETLQSKKLDYLTFEGVVCPIIEIKGSFDDYKRGLKKKLINDIRRRERRLKEKGELKIMHYSGEISLEILTNFFIQQHMKRWDRTNTPSKFHKIQHQRYYKLLLQDLYDNNLLDLFYLKLDNKILAFHFGSVFNNKVLFHTPTFDPDYSKYAPSKILLFHVIKSCFLRNIAIFDFLAGSERYKYDWTKKENRYINMVIFKNKLSKIIYQMIYHPEFYTLFRSYKRGL